jgi:hypothetical protein
MLATETAIGARPRTQEDLVSRFIKTITFVSCFAGALIPNAYGGLVAAYTFGNTLAAVEPGVTALTAVDPLGTSGYQTATVFGNSRTTYNFNGAASPASDQGGLDFNTTGLISTTYSVEMIVSLTAGTGWRRLLDSLDRQSDSGLYIDPNSNLDDFPSGAGTGSPFTANSFFDIFVTVDPANIVTGYLNGAQQFSVSSSDLVIATNTLGFFLDNTAAGGQNEWSSGNVALIKIFDTVLTPGDVAAETADPFQGTTTSGTPEPGSWLLVLSGVAGAVIMKRRGWNRS